mmetsp:Transcript_8719/g.9908  ORF Transcript_8719/g.9908 Transcript_8719/m.9908 type:complete len:90 (+) Transcript_8719:447-716(+)
MRKALATTISTPSEGSIPPSVKGSKKPSEFSALLKSAEGTSKILEKFMTNDTLKQIFSKDYSKEDFKLRIRELKETSTNKSLHYIPRKK